MTNIIKNYKLQIFASFIPFGTILFYYNRLPERVATHFDTNNTVNGTMSKPIFLLLPLFLVLLEIFLLWVEQKKGTQDKKIISLTAWIIPAISLWATGASIQYSVYNEANILNTMPLLLGLIFIIMGNYMPKASQNRTFGIRIPSTLNNADNWYHTHRLAGKVWVIAGLFLIVMTVVNFNPVWILVTTVVAVVIPVVYSLTYKAK
ncbi:DUF1648 domain-containing protein [Vagococcus coleopterorum]|uniref:DUF1648 domain-containing protein n=1 Tax=Vagococcus coleopterorum TaxID=2714946 RepID=A0A6G8AMJ1_9ENTE|nr:SdpI family protein [Vagococcus coleopterorum]QIL46217.1 DUF1648 domain-containing protein [Vagococcus coleopterorum]